MPKLRAATLLEPLMVSSALLCAGCPLLADDPFVVGEHRTEGGGSPSGEDGGLADAFTGAGGSVSSGGSAGSVSGGGDAGAASSGGDAGSAGSEPGAGGSEPSTGGGDAGATCSVDEAAVLTVCPPVCTRGCLDGTCFIACADKDACKDQVLLCPIGMRCQLECLAEHACEAASLLCPVAHACSVRCGGGKEACKKLTVSCGDADCSIQCDGEKGCDEASVECGKAVCRATCSSNTRPPALSCGDACSCEPC